MLSTHLSEVISFHFLRQYAIFPALNFLFDILISSSIFLPVCHSVLAFLLWFTIGSAVFCNFDGMDATDSACTEVFLLMPSIPCTKKEDGFYFLETYEREVI